MFYQLLFVCRVLHTRCLLWGSTVGYPSDTLASCLYTTLKMCSLLKKCDSVYLVAFFACISLLTTLVIWYDLQKLIRVAEHLQLRVRPEYLIVEIEPQCQFVIDQGQAIQESRAAARKPRNPRFDARSTRSSTLVGCTRTRHIQAMYDRLQKCLHGMGPIYLSKMCRPRSSEAGRRHLRSANRGQHSFPATG